MRKQTLSDFEHRDGIKALRLNKVKVKVKMKAQEYHCIGKGENILTSNSRMQIDISVIPAITPLLCCFHDLSRMLQSLRPRYVDIYETCRALPTTPFPLTPGYAPGFCSLIRRVPI
jgi:hypothetical protein